MKKTKVVIVVFLLSIFFLNIKDVNAVELKLDDNDYQITCIYEEGTQVTVSRSNIYMIKSSTTIDSNDDSALYLFEEQRNVYNAGRVIIEYNHDEFLKKELECSPYLYVFRVPRSLINYTEDEGFSGEGFSYYYSSKEIKVDEEAMIKSFLLEEGSNDLAWLISVLDDLAGNSFAENIWEDIVEVVKLSNSVSGEKIALVSEEIFLLTDKETTICDYETVIDEGSTSASSQSLSIYKYDIPLIETGGRITRLEGDAKNGGGCPAYLSQSQINFGNPNGEYLYVNDPFPKEVGEETSGNYEYVKPNFQAIEDDSGTCKDSYNDGNECWKFQYVGSRRGAGSGNTDDRVCQFVGNDIVVLLQEVFSVLQIVVPALVIVLVAVDITKMVLSGNLNDELPKRKKLMIVRFIVMIVFFFAPLITNLIIDLLKDSGVNVGSVECIFTTVD